MSNVFERKKTKSIILTVVMVVAIIALFNQIPAKGLIHEELANADNNKDTAVTILDAYNKWDGRVIVNSRSYSSGSTIYYEDDSTEFTIQLPWIEGLNSTTEDLVTLKDDFVSVVAADENLRKRFLELGERFDHLSLMVSTSSPNMIRFKLNAVTYDFKVQFRKDGSDDVREFLFRKTEPFTYEVRTPFANSLKTWQTSTSVRQYLKVGQTYRYNMEFSLPVDRESLQKSFAWGLADIDWTLDWLSDRSATLTLRVRENDRLDEYEDFYIYPYGVKSQSGLELNPSGENANLIRIQPTIEKSYISKRMDTGSTRLLFQSLVEYATLDISPNGGWMLASEIYADQNVIVPVYTILDQHGDRMKELGSFRFPPVWTPDGNSLLYSTNNRVIRYQIGTGEKRVIWSALTEPMDLSFQFDQASGRMLVAAGNGYERGYPVDLYLFENLEDVEPRRIADVLYFTQDHFSYVFSYPVKFIDSDTIYYETDREHGNGTNANERYWMNWDDVKQMRIEEEGQFFVAGGGKMIRIHGATWSYYDYMTGQEEVIWETKGEEIAYPYVEAAINDHMYLIIMGDNEKYVLDVKKGSLEHVSAGRLVLPIMNRQGEIIYKMDASTF